MGTCATTSECAGGTGRQPVTIAWHKSQYSELKSWKTPDLGMSFTLFALLGQHRLDNAYNPLRLFLIQRVGMRRSELTFVVIEIQS